MATETVIRGKFPQKCPRVVQFSKCPLGVPKLKNGTGVCSIAPHSTDAWVGSCAPGAQTLTLFKTQIADFATLFRQHLDFFRTSLVRHETQNHTQF